MKTAFSVPLKVLRVGWVVLVLAYIAFYIAATPPMIEAFTRDANQLFSTALPQLGLTPQTYAAYFLFLNLLTPSVAMALGLLIFVKRPDDRIALLMAGGLVAFTVVVGRATTAFTNTYPDLFWIPSLLRLIGGAFAVAVFSLFPNGKFIPAWAPWYLFFGIFVLGPFINDIRLYLQPNITSPYSLISMVYLGIGVGFQTWRYRYYSTTSERQQTKWVVYGLSISVLFVSLFIIIDVFVPSVLLTGNPLIRLIYRLFANTFLIFIPTLFAPIAISIAITRNRLWDIDLLINRSLVVAITTLALGLGFFAVIVGLQAVLPSTLGSLPVIAAAIGAGTAFNPLRGRVQQVIDRRFYRWRFDLNQLAAAERGQSSAKFGILTGQTIDGYRVEGLVGKGGMGEVYQAHKDNRTYAFKTLLSDATPDHRERFKREIAAMEQLQHPNIVRFYGAALTPSPYLLLEYIDGVNLETYLKQRGKFSPYDALLIGRGIAEALDYAHGRGVIHRDLKPSNVLIRAAHDGVSVTPLLVDFGIAKVSDAASLTGTGAVGTINYMAPEQIRSSKRVTHKADIYAFGVILYEMLTGKPPFTGDIGQVLFAHLQQPPPDITIASPDLPEDFNRILGRALAKNADERWLSAGELIAELAQSLAQSKA